MKQISEVWCMIFKRIFVIFIISKIFINPATASSLQPIEVTTIDPAAMFMATFASYNQKVVVNSYGIFMTYKKDGDEEDRGRWYLMRSTDGGKNFTQVYVTNTASKAPAIATSSNGTIYLAHPYQFYKFSPASNFSTPQITSFSDGSGSYEGKFSMIIDEPRNRLYYFSTNGQLISFDLQGNEKESVTITRTWGANARIMYPLLHLDSTNVLYAAWTTQSETTAGGYWDIHFMLSKTGNLRAWQKLNGTSLTLPVIPDDTGPTDRVTRDDEFDPATWLWTIFSQKNKLFFAYRAYQASPAKMYVRFVRYDTSSKIKDLDLTPWKGQQINFNQLIDGFCATKKNQPSYPIFCASRIAGAVVNGKRQFHIGILVSFDQGATWQDYAQTTASPTGLVPGQISGDLEITPDGYMIGSYTDMGPHIENKFAQTSAVRFFRVKVSTSPLPTPAPSTKPGDLNSDSKVNIFDYNLLVANFGKTSTNLVGDIDKNGKVDLFDYNVLIGNFGKTP